MIFSFLENGCEFRVTSADVPDFFLLEGGEQNKTFFILILYFKFLYYFKVLLLNL